MGSLSLLLGCTIAHSLWSQHRTLFSCIVSQRRRVQLEIFMEHVISHPILSHSVLVNDFISHNKVRAFFFSQCTEAA
jgi:hypothetical protein